MGCTTGCSNLQSNHFSKHLNPRDTCDSPEDVNVLEYTPINKSTHPPKYHRPIREITESHFFSNEEMIKEIVDKNHRIKNLSTISDENDITKMEIFTQVGGHVTY
jgi:hypothetical protein